MVTNLFIGAHPDDIEIGCGGTVAKLVEEGQKCIFVIATKGDQGSLKYSTEELAEIRKKEAIASADFLGAHEIEFLELADGLTRYEFSDKIKLIEIIRRYKPFTIFTHSQFDRHPDHKIIHELTVTSIKSAAGPWFKEAKGKPHHVSNILGYEVWNPINEYQTAVDITQYLDKKLAALALHKSQTEDYPYTSGVQGLANYRGAMINGHGGAEVYEVLRLKTY